MVCVQQVKQCFEGGSLEPCGGGVVTVTCLIFFIEEPQVQ